MRAAGNRLKSESIRRSSSFFPPSGSSAARTSLAKPSRSALSVAVAGRAPRVPERAPLRTVAMDTEHIRPKEGSPVGPAARPVMGWLVATLAGATLLGGCALNGDFGRLRSDLVTDDMHAWVGRDAVASIGGKPSDFLLTDNERRLRDLAYALIQPAYDRNRWDS